MHCIKVVECSNEIFQAGFVTKRVDQWLQSMMDFFHLYHRGALDGDQEWRASASTSNTWTVNGTEISREITKSVYFGPTNLIDTGLWSAGLQFSDSKHQPQIVQVLGGLVHHGVKDLSIVEPHLYEEQRCASLIKPFWLPHSPQHIISGTASSLEGIAYIQQ